MIFGHELVHDYDVFHTNTADSCGSSDSNSDFPYASSSIQEFGYNTTTGKVYNPSNTHDLMSYCPAGGSREGWISPFTWNRMFNELSVSKPYFKAVEGEEQLKPYQYYLTSNHQSLSVNATVLNPDYNHGDYLGSLHSLHLVETGVTYLPKEGDYAIELRSGTEVLSRQPFWVSFENEYGHKDHHGDDEEEGAPYRTMDAHFIIPWDAATDTVVLLHGEDVLDQRPISANAPTVVFTNPVVAANWPEGSPQLLSWTGQDLDGDALHYTLLYSNNDRMSWEILGTQLTEESFVVSAPKNVVKVAGFQTLRVSKTLRVCQICSMEI